MSDIQQFLSDTAVRETVTEFLRLLMVDGRWPNVARGIADQYGIDVK